MNFGNKQGAMPQDDFVPEPQAMNLPYPGQLQTTQQDVKVTELILENESIIDELTHTLRGEWIDKITNQIYKIGNPIIKEEALIWIISKFNLYTSKVFSASVLDEKTVKQIIYEFESEVSMALMFPEVLGVSRDKRDEVKWILVHSFMATIYKALNGVTLKRLLEQHHISEIGMGVAPQPKMKGGMLRL